MIPGEYFLKTEDIICNEGKVITSITVVNTGDRPVQVGSHFHFFEINRQMDFDREKSFGKHLNIASGTATRFEPGEKKIISLVSFGGNQFIHGFNNLSNGKINEDNKSEALKKITTCKFKNTSHEPKH